MDPRQAVNQLQFNLDRPASPSNLVTRVAVNPQPVLIEKRPSALDPRRMELMSRLARRELQHSRESLDARLPPGPKNVERRLHQGRAAISRKAAIEQQRREQQQQLPSRSHSPPVRDTDRAWRPAKQLVPRENAASMKRHEALELRRLREEVQQYAARMAELEAERLLGRGAGGAAKRRPVALPFPTRPRSPRVGLAPPPQRQQQQQQRQHPRFNPTQAASPAPVQAAASTSPMIANQDRARIVAEVLAEIRRELGLRGGGGGGFSTPALSASAVSLIPSGAGSLTELRNIDHRLCQLEAEGDDIRDRWAAALASGDEPVCAVDGSWRADPSDGLRFVNNRNGAGPAPIVSGAVEVAGARQPAVLQLTQAEVQAIRSQRDRYRDYLHAGSSLANSGVVGFRPTQLTDAIAEQLLDDMLTDAADELLSASDAIVGHLVASETGVGDAEAAAAAALSALGARTGGYSPTEEPDARAAGSDDYYSNNGEDGEDDYGSQEFESEHSSDNGDSR